MPEYEEVLQELQRQEPFKDRLTLLAKMDPDSPEFHGYDPEWGWDKPDNTVYDAPWLPFIVRAEKEKVIALQDRAAALEKQVGELDGVAAQLTSANQLLEANEARAKANEARRVAKEARGKATAEAAEFRRQISALATGITAITNGALGIVSAAKGGNPFAISAASIDLAGAVVSTAAALTGPWGAAAGALLGALMGMISSILKAFIPAEPPLFQRIETLLREIGAENTGHDLHSATKAIWAFENAAHQAADASMTYDQVIALLNPVEGNTMRDLRRSDGWLLEPKNLHTKQWPELLSARLDAYKRLTLAYARWLPKLKAGEAERLLRIVNVNDPAELEFLEKVKPAARARGRFWTLSKLWGTIGAREAPDDWTSVRHAHPETIAVAYPGGAPSAHPEAVLFAMWDQVRVPLGTPVPTLDSTAASRRLAKHPFAKKRHAWMLCIDWPYKERQVWKTVDELAGCYDVWATTASEPGAVDVHVATGPTIRRYRHATHDHADKPRLVQQWESRPTGGYTVTAVRTATRPRLGPGPAAAMTAPMEWAAYGLCEVESGRSVAARESVYFSEHFEIMACYSDGSQYYVYPPWKGQQGKAVPQPPQPWDTVSGIAADDDYLWVFRAGTIAFATHAEISFAARTISHVPWTVYDVPKLGNGDPRASLFKGVRDLTSCADGTLTIAYHDAGSLFGQPGEVCGPELLWTSAPLVRVHADGRRELVIETKTGGGHHATATTHGWSNLDRNQPAQRVIKTPIFCWPVLEALGKAVRPQPTAPRP